MTHGGEERGDVGEQEVGGDLEHAVAQVDLLEQVGRRAAEEEADDHRAWQEGRAAGAGRV